MVQMGDVVMKNETNMMMGLLLHQQKSMERKIRGMFSRKRHSVDRIGKIPEKSSQDSLDHDCAIPSPPCASPITSMPGATNGQIDKHEEERELVEFIRANLEGEGVSKTPSKDRDSPTVESEGRRSPSSVTGSQTSGKGRKKRPATWFNNMISPNYKTRSDELRKQFKDVSPEERLLIDYSCALQKNILVHGRLYVTQGYICFYSNIFTMETSLTIRCKDITAITKEKTARVIPNAVQITTGTDKYFFTSFGSRDKTFLTLFRVWQNSQLEQPLSSQQLWSWIHAAYGEELGLTASDDDYIAPSPDDLSNLQHDNFDRSITRKEENEKPDGSFLNSTELHPDGISMGTSSTDELAPHSPPGLMMNSHSLPSPTSESSKQKELATDSGDTTEDSDGEVVCDGHDHRGNPILDKVFNINVDTLFEMLFSDSDFMRAFYKERKTSDVVMSPWQNEEDGQSKTKKFRTLSYTLTLGASFGPKTAPATEKQSFKRQSQEGRCYFIECRCINDPSLPYGENFYTVNNFCLTRVTANKTRIKVHSEIVYIKSVWGLVKSIIDKNVNSGVSQYYSALRTVIQRESDNQAVVNVNAHSNKKKVIRRRKRASSTERSITNANYSTKSVSVAAPVPEAPAKPASDLVFLGISGESLVRLMCIVLISLVLMNAVLFYKLSSLESVSLYSQQNLEILKNSPRSQEDWVSILQTQSGVHEQELAKWKFILDSSITLLDQMKATLQDLQEGVEKRQDLLKS